MAQNIAALLEAAILEVNDGRVTEHDRERFNRLPYTKRLILFVDQQTAEESDDPRWPPLWAPQYVKLHRINLADINYELAALKQKLLENSELSKKDLRKLRRLLNAQVTALRNYEYVHSLDRLNKGDRDACRSAANEYFPEVATARGYNEEPFDSGAYKYVADREEPYPHGDFLRDWLCRHLPVWFTYSAAEKSDRSGDYKANIVPIGVGPRVERLARLLIALFGAVSILVPMIIMSLHESKTKSLITTSVFVLAFAFTCSLTLHTSNDQTLAATAGYGAVLMVFVGLTS